MRRRPSRRKGSKGKKNSDIGKRDFLKWYKENCKNPLPESKVKHVYEDLMKGLGELISIHGEKVHIPNLGHFYVQLYRPKKLRPDGSLNLGVLPKDLKATEDLWLEKWPDKSWDEILEIPDKPIVYHRNDHSKGYMPRTMWDHKNYPIRNKRIYRFIPVTKVREQISQTMRDGDSEVLFTVKTK